MKSLGCSAVWFVDLEGVGACSWVLSDGEHGLWNGICVENFVNFDEVSSEATEFRGSYFEVFETFRVWEAFDFWDEF